MGKDESSIRIKSHPTEDSKYVSRLQLVHQSCGYQTTLLPRAWDVVLHFGWLGGDTIAGLVSPSLLQGLPIPKRRSFTFAFYSGIVVKSFVRNVPIAICLFHTRIYSSPSECVMCAMNHWAGKMKMEKCAWGLSKNTRTFQLQNHISEEPSA
jgi:hypothetical protein